MIKKVFKLVLKILLWFLGTSIMMVILFKYIPIPITPLMIIRCVEQKKEGKPLKLKHKWVALKEISPNLQKAVIISEDGSFLSHNGFDFDAIQKAYKNNKNQKNTKGGSTITQQTAKNVFLWPKRSFIRKGFEAYFTVLIEFFWSKERIMEVYLNSIEMGDGIYGAEAASIYWYQKGAHKLSPSEAAGIAAILPNPKKYKATNSGPYITNRKRIIAKYITNFGKLEYEK